MLVSFLGIDFKLVIFLVSIHWINWSSFMQYSTLKHPVAYSARVSFQLRRDICIVHNMQLLLHLILCAWNCVTCNVKLSSNFTWELIRLRLEISSIVVVQRVEIKMINIRECCIYSCRYELYIKGCMSLNFHCLMIDDNNNYLIDQYLM